MNTSQNRQSLESQLIEKALKDDAFRKKLADDPKGAIESDAGIKLPEDLQIEVHQETKNTLHMVLPYAPRAKAELKPEEMLGADCSGWSSAGECVLECTQCGNNDTTCAPGPTEE